MKLAENPYDDVDKLIHSWYDAAVGKDAAKYLAQYYDFWNDFWIFFN